MSFRVFLIFCLGISLNFYSQEKKQLHISRTDQSPIIDGHPDDSIWKVAQEATDFTQFRPDAGVKADFETRTIVKMAYDNDAIYIFAYLYDDPKLIMSQLSKRDDFGQTDFFAVILNPNNDAQNDTNFFVMSSGVQADAIANPSIGEDFGWNAVWESAVQMQDDGWTVEMKIPYRCLRFSNQPIQTWGLQFHRHFRRNRSQYTWNPLNVRVGYLSLYHGELVGLENIEPPTRLSLYPFTSGLYNNFDGQTDSDLNVGVDVKYGITENFTLDMTLIPDFSQAGFDNLELNLSPFEQTFSEQRQFFTEGVDLFNKGDLFFSRRVGNAPSGSIELNDDEDVVRFPLTVKVLNAAKVSGRTKNGLGVGVFNAVTEKTDATIKNLTSEEIRNEVVEPLTNYNILVADQQFNKNSSASIINTSVLRNGSFRDANVTGLLADVTNKRNTYNVKGEIKRSDVHENGESTEGYRTDFGIYKVSGNYQYGFEHRYADTKYDINDLGLLLRNNFNQFEAGLSYRTFEPTKTLNNYRWEVGVNYNRLSNPNTYAGTSINASYNAQTKRTLLNYGVNINFQPGTQYDYFEPRSPGRYFIYENRLEPSFYYSSTYNNPFALDIRGGGVYFFEEVRETYEYYFRVSPRFRFNDRFILIYSFDYNRSYKDRGYATTINDDIIFGERNQRVLTNRLRGEYNFNPYHALGLTFRNYWSTVDYYNDLYTLAQNGTLTQALGYKADELQDDPNINFSTWNLDLNYTWQFAPGSFLTALYRNQLFNLDDQSEINYNQSLKSLFDQPIQHTFSLKLQYFLDYNDAKSFFKGKNKKTS